MCLCACARGREHRRENKHVGACLLFTSRSVFWCMWQHSCCLDTHPARYTPPSRVGPSSPGTHINIQFNVNKTFDFLNNSPFTHRVTTSTRSLVDVVSQGCSISSRLPTVISLSARIARELPCCILRDASPPCTSGKGQLRATTCN